MSEITQNKSKTTTNHNTKDKPKEITSIDTTIIDEALKIPDEYGPTALFHKIKKTLSKRRILLKNRRKDLIGSPSNPANPIPQQCHSYELSRLEEENRENKREKSPKQGK